MSAVWSPTFPLSHYLLRASAVYLAVLILLRIAGKRQVGQMGIGEFVGLLLISNSVQNAMNGGDNSLTGGFILAATLVAWGAGVSYLTYRSKRLENLVNGRPTLLIHNGRPLHPNLEKELLTLHEIRARLRHQGVHSIDEVAEAVLESDGYLSIIRQSEVRRDGRPKQG